MKANGFEAGLPMSLIYYHNWQARTGFALRMGYFFVGGDALGSLLKLTDFERTDFYGGIHFFIPYKKFKSRPGILSDKNKLNQEY